MSIQTKRLKFEQQLAQLKQDYADGSITLDDYIEQAGSLRFDEADQTWWLDPESGNWYVAPLGTENFQEYIPLADTKSPPPQPAPEPVSPEPEPQSEAPHYKPEFKTQPEPPPFKHETKPQSKTEPVKVKTEPSTTSSGKKFSFIWMGIILMIIALLGVTVILVSSFLTGQPIPTATMVAAQFTPTHTPLPPTSQFPT